MRRAALGRAVFGRAGSMRRPIGFLLASCVIASLLSPAFLSFRNFGAILTSSSFLIVAAVGEAFVIMLGMIDLGLESVLAAGGMFAAWITVFHSIPAAPAVVLTLCAGAGTGATVGLLVTRGRIPSFIVTLSTYWGIRGVALLFNHGNYISPDSVTPPHSLGFGGLAGNVGGVSVLILIAITVVALGQIAISFTPIGSWVKTVGSNENAARSVGLSTDAIKIAVFSLSGLLAALGGVMVTAWQNSIYPLTGQGDSLAAIAGVILGGIPFTGGRGSIVGAALGVLVISVINDVIVLIGLPDRYQYIFVACVLILAGLQARGGRWVK